MGLRVPGRLKSLYILCRQRYRVRRWQKLETRGGQMEFRLPEGFRMELHADSELCRLIYLSSFEWWERQLTRQLLQPGDIYFDVGANIGLFSLLASQCVGSEGQVHSFEPFPETFDRLQRNLQITSCTNIEPHPWALSSTDGTTLIRSFSDGKDAWNTMAEACVADSPNDSFEIPTRRLDDFVASHDLTGRIRMMKIDVEGWETQVLAGGRETLLRDDAPLLMVEFAEVSAQSAGSSCKELYGALVDLGYTMYCIDPETRKLKHDPLRDRYSSVNLFAAKNPQQIGELLL